MMWWPVWRLLTPCLVVWTAVCVWPVSGELFTSSAHLQTALYAEKDIAHLLHDYVEQEQQRLDSIKKLANDYETHSRESLDNIDSALGNPVNAFLLIKRFTLDWDRDVLPIMNNSSIEALRQEIDAVRADLPTYEDLKGAASALMRLQDTYHLDTHTLAHGDIRGIQSTPLTVEDCFELGRISYNAGDYYHTMLWMQEALEEKLVNEVRQEEEEKAEEPFDWVVEQSGDAEKVKMLDFLAFSHFKLGDLRQALALTNELLEIDPSHQRASNNRNYFIEMLRDPQHREPDNTVPGYQLNRDEYRNSDEFLTYEALCRGEDTQPNKKQQQMTCRYVHNNHPLLILSPVKQETVHLEPFVAIYHGIMSDDEIRQIKTLATPRLNRATVQNAKTGELETASYRISKSAWLKGEEHPVVARINRRMEAVTGLDMDTAEELQIANYGLGGQYEPHFDFARKEEKDAFKSLGTGNRIATFMFYMSDVQAGGATVFPYIGLKLYPKKGNAAFWYNLYKNGDGIYNTRHAACPVLVGTKWVSNKWIHERGQEFRRPCALGEDE